VKGAFDDLEEIDFEIDNKKLQKKDSPKNK
jgi:hypothetical protein